MYIGVYISCSFISTAFVDQDGEMVLIKDESINDAKKYLTPLTIYMEDSFAYLGHQVDYLLANDYDLNYGRYFLDNLENTGATVYKDKTNVCWNAVAIMAIFLKKIKADIQAYDDHPIQGAIVTTSKILSHSLNKALKLAFDMADVRLCGVIDMGRAALNGYNVNCNSSKTVLLYDSNPLAITVSVLKIEKDNDNKTLIFKSQKNLGEHALYQYLMNFLFKKYEGVAKREVRRDKKNTIRLQQLVKELLLKYTCNQRSYITVIYSFEDPVIELVITRAQLDNIVGSYINQTLTFLKECLEIGAVGVNDISEVMFTGTSKIHKLIKMQLQLLFGDSVNIHHDCSEEVITKGVAVCANDPIKRECSASSLNTLKDLTVEEVLEDAPNFKELIPLVKAMHVNVVAEG